MCSCARASITNCHKRGDLQRPKFTLTALEARKLIARCQQGWRGKDLEAPREDTFLASLLASSGSWNSRYNLACDLQN